MVAASALLNALLGFFSNSRRASFVADLGHVHGFGHQISEDGDDATESSILVQDAGKINGFGQKISDSGGFLVPSSKEVEIVASLQIDSSVVKSLGSIQHFGEGDGPGLSPEFKLDVHSRAFQGQGTSVRQPEELSAGSVVKSMGRIQRFGAGGGPGPSPEMASGTSELVKSLSNIQRFGTGAGAGPRAEMESGASDLRKPLDDSQPLGVKVELAASEVRLLSSVQRFGSGGGPGLPQSWQPVLGLEASEFAAMQRMRRLGAVAALCLVAFVTFCRLVQPKARKGKEANVGEASGLQGTETETSTS